MDFVAKGGALSRLRFANHCGRKVVNNRRGQLRQHNREARANMRQMWLAYPLGSANLEAKALMAYAAVLPPKSKDGAGMYATPHRKSEFINGLNDEIRDSCRKGEIPRRLDLPAQALEMNKSGK